MLSEFGAEGREDGRRNADREAPGGVPMSDREVPLSRRPTPAVVQAWLDGDVPMREASRGDTRTDVEFWTRINEQAAERRHMRTPAHVQQRIMEAIPSTSPTSETGWLQREAHITNGTLMLIGAALLGIGVVVSLLFAR